MQESGRDGSDLRYQGQTQVARDVLYRSLFEHTHAEVHIWEVVRDEQGRVVTWRLMDANAAALESWNRNLTDVVGKSPEEIFPGGDAVAIFLPVVSEIMASGKPKEWELEFPATGQILQMVSIPVGTYFVSTGTDVTSIRTKERKLREALISLNQATQAGGVGLWDWDLRTNAVRYSDEWKRQLGYAPDEISDTFEEWRTRVHADDLAPTMDRVRARIADPSRSYDVVFRMKHRDGSYRWILAQSSFVLGEQGSPIRMLGSHVDITERRRLEERVIESQKLESIGTLAAGIAHDFNNLLGAITGNLSLLRSTPSSDPEAPELLKELDDATKRAQALTYQLLTFAKGSAPIREMASVRDLVVDSARFVTRGSTSLCKFELPDDLATVEADVGQLSQVVDNLVINAMQAMPRGGTIRIRAANVSLGDKNEWALPRGDYVRISVADDGIGIPRDELPRIFDPFYTTKSAGSGLGLSTSYAIISRHGGRITVESTAGQGATFHVHLPASRTPVPTRSETVVIAGAGRILVMDDDAALRKLFRRMLERLGYACDVSGDGDDAVQRYAEMMRAGQPYDAVILDLTIPGRPGGTEALSRLRELHPQVVAIVTSGYADDDVMARYEVHGFRGRLRKPVDLASFSAELTRVLATSAPPAASRT